MSERGPVGFGTAWVAELRFLAERRWALIVPLVLGGLLVNWLIRGRDGGMLFVVRVDAVRMLVAMAWGSAIWTGERPSEREYLLAEPVGGARHEIARVLAGAVYLTLANALMLLGEWLRATPVSPATMGAAYVIASLVGPLIQYLVVAAIGLASAWPVAWFLGSYLAVGLLAMLKGQVGAFMHQVYFGRSGFSSAVMPVVYDGPPTPPQGIGPQPVKITWIGPHWGTWAPGAAIWLGVALIALLLFANRRRGADLLRRLATSLRLARVHTATASAGGHA